MIGHSEISEMLSRKCSGPVTASPVGRSSTTTERRELGVGPRMPCECTPQAALGRLTSKNIAPILKVDG